MSLSYTAQKNEVPSVYVMEVFRYRNFVIANGEADVLSEDETRIIYGVFSEANECSINVWNLMASDEVSEDNGPIAMIKVTLMPIDELNPAEHEESHRMCEDFLACETEGQVFTKVEDLRL